MMTFTVTIKTYYGYSTFAIKAESYKTVWPRAWDTMRVSHIRGTIVSIKMQKTS